MSEDYYELTERDWANIARVQNGLDILSEKEIRGEKKPTQMGVTP